MSIRIEIVVNRFRFYFSLRLEWNQLGAMNSPAFSVFCDALADNKSVIELDLRNNDINHVGGSELASALKRNTTLRALGTYNTYQKDFI